MEVNNKSVSVNNNYENYSIKTLAIQDVVKKVVGMLMVVAIVVGSGMLMYYGSHKVVGLGTILFIGAFVLVPMGCCALKLLGPL